MKNPKLFHNMKLNKNFSSDFFDLLFECTVIYKSLNKTLKELGLEIGSDSVA